MCSTAESGCSKKEQPDCIHFTTFRTRLRWWSSARWIHTDRLQSEYEASASHAFDITSPSYRQDGRYEGRVATIRSSLAFVQGEKSDYGLIDSGVTHLFFRRKSALYIQITISGCGNNCCQCLFHL